MLPSERYQEISMLLSQKGSVKVSQLSKILHVSPATLRRDLIFLENNGMVIREYGAVCASRHMNGHLPLFLRGNEKKEEKMLIAQKAAEMIKDEGTIFLDGSTISHLILPYLANYKHLIVVSNSISICEELISTGVIVYGLGGRLSYKDYIFVGSYAEEMIQKMTFDQLFFSSSGLSLNGEINGVSDPAVSFLRKAITRANHVIYMCDSSRIGKSNLHTICTLSDVDEVLSDKTLPQSLSDQIGKKPGDLTIHI